MVDAQWEEFVERDGCIVPADQTTRVTAAVDAGRQAYLRRKRRA